MIRLAIIGFGEVGQRLAQDLSSRPDLTITVWDRLFIEPDSTPGRAAERMTVQKAPALGDAVDNATHVISAVTAAEAIPVAMEAGPLLSPGVWYLDVNSISPSSRASAAAAVQLHGARYIEAAVMSPIEPHGCNSPILLGGPHASAFPVQDLGLGNARVYDSRLGTASAAKLCRSVVIKGLEALMTESLCAARHYGVETTVLESFRHLFAHPDISEFARYLITRSLQHGTRRADEMEEAAGTVRDAGLAPWLAEATAARQRWSGERQQTASRTLSLSELLDATRLETPC